MTNFEVKPTISIVGYDERLDIWTTQFDEYDNPILIEAIASIIGQYYDLATQAGYPDTYHIQITDLNKGVSSAWYLVSKYQAIAILVAMQADPKNAPTTGMTLIDRWIQIGLIAPVDKVIGSSVTISTADDYLSVEVRFEVLRQYLSSCDRVVLTTPAYRGKIARYEFQGIEEMDNVC